MSNSKTPKIRRCIVCSNTNRTATDVSYFRIPIDQDYAEKWFINLRRTDLLDNLSLHTSSFICSDHFPPDRMFMCKANDQILKRLKRGALPYKITEDGQVEDPTSEKSDDENDESFDCSIADMIRQKMYAADDTSGLDTTTNGYADNETSTNDIDEDFNLDLFDDVDPKEIEQYKTHFPKLEKIADSKTHCTSCQYHIGTAPINEAFIKMHPILRVTQCKKCFTFYNSGEFERGEDGSELYCRWCGQGGEVYCCSNCPYVFCRRCIVHNLSRNMVTEIQNNENWSCFACAPQCMIPLRASHWALVNFIEKQKREITNQTVDEIEMNELMSNDISRCCSSSKKRCSLKRKVENTAVITPPPPEKRRSYAPSPRLVNSTRKSVENKAAAEDDDSVAVQCTPDILSLFNNEEQSSSSNTQAGEAPPLRIIRREVTIRPNQSVATRQSLPTPPRQPTPTPPHPIVTPSPPIPTASPVQTTATASNPVYHTINGFRIDLNTAAQQETYRLPNGKLIQVKKQTPSVTPTGSTPSERTPPVVSRPPTMMTRPPHAAATRPPVVTRPSMLPQRAPTMPPIRTHISTRNSVGPPAPVRPVRQPQFQVQHRQPIQIQTRFVGNSQIRVMNGPIIQQLPPPQQQPTVQQTNNPNNPPPLVFRTGHGNTPVGKARTQFEERVDNSMEVCQHIIGKINTLTSSSSYKKVKSLMDLKDLTIHLSYLLTYAIGRFKTLQEKCIEDMKAMGFDPDRAPGATSDDDDIEIVEPKTTTINLDSDEEEEVPASSTNNTEHNNSNTEQAKSVSNGDHNIENAAPSQTQQNHLGKELAKNNVVSSNNEVEKQQNTDNPENVNDNLVDKQLSMDVSNPRGSTETSADNDDDVLQVVEEISVNENDATQNLAQVEVCDKLNEVGKDKPVEENNETEPAKENESKTIPEPTNQVLDKDNVGENNVQKPAKENEDEVEQNTEKEPAKENEDEVEQNTEKEPAKENEDKVEQNTEKEPAKEIEAGKISETTTQELDKNNDEAVQNGSEYNIQRETKNKPIATEIDKNTVGTKLTDNTNNSVTDESVNEEEPMDVSDSTGLSIENPANNDDDDVLMIETIEEAGKKAVSEEREVTSVEITSEKLANQTDEPVQGQVAEPVDKTIPETPATIEEEVIHMKTSANVLALESETSQKNLEIVTPLLERIVPEPSQNTEKDFLDKVVDEPLDTASDISKDNEDVLLAEEKHNDVSRLLSIKENVVEDLPEEINNIEVKTPLSEGKEESAIVKLPKDNIVGSVPEATEEKSSDAIMDESIEVIVEQNPIIADEITEFLDKNADTTVIPDVPEAENITNPIADILCDKIGNNISLPVEIDDSMCVSNTAGDNLSLIDEIGDSLCERTTAANEDMDCDDKLTDNVCLPDDIATSTSESVAPGDGTESSTLLDDIIMKTLELDTSV